MTVNRPMYSEFASRLPKRRNQYDDYVKAFGKHVRRLRLVRNMTQEELSYKSGLQLSHLGRIERGERTLTLPTLCVLAVALNVEPKHMLDFTFQLVINEFN